MTSRTVLSHESTVKLFADYTNVFIFGTTIAEVYCKANRTIVALNEWFYGHKLSLNVDKSSYSVLGCQDDNAHHLLNG